MKLAIVVVLAALCAPALAKPDPTAGLAKVPAQQLEAFDPGRTPLPASLAYANGALFTVTGDSAYGSAGRTPPDELAAAIVGAYYGGADVKNVAVGLAADGQTAWLSFDAHVHVLLDGTGEFWKDERASELLAKDGAGWKLVGGAWSTPSPNAKINAAAKAGKLGWLDDVVDGDPDGDAGVRAAFDALLATGVDATAAARKDLIAIGSAAGERTTTGAAIARAWKAAWVGHVTLDGKPRLGLAPSGKTAWVSANVSLTKGRGASAYKLPFRIFAVFDQIGGAWSLVHVHLAVPTPS